MNSPFARLARLARPAHPVRVARPARLAPLAPRSAAVAVALVLAGAMMLALAPPALRAQSSSPSSHPMAAPPTSAVPNGQGAPSTPSPDAMKAMMDAYGKAAQPGEHHKRLDGLVGKWTVTGKVWMGPGPAIDMTGGVESESMLGGRYVGEKHTGSFMGQPFEGHALDGYDNTTHEYFTAWIDNMGTGLTVYRGNCDAACKVLTLSGDEVDPVSGRKMSSKEVVTFADADTYRTEMYMVGAGPGGQDLKVMDITAKRVH
jgi:hypothetical protein